MSFECTEKIFLNSLHNSLKVFCCSSETLASCNYIFRCTSMSVGDIINFFFLLSETVSSPWSWSTSISLSSSNKIGEGFCRGLSYYFRYVQRLILHKTHNPSFQKRNIICQKINNYQGYIFCLMYIHVMYHRNNVQILGILQLENNWAQSHKSVHFA